MATPERLAIELFDVQAGFVEGQGDQRPVEAPLQDRFSQRPAEILLRMDIQQDLAGPAVGDQGGEEEGGDGGNGANCDLGAEHVAFLQFMKGLIHIAENTPGAFQQSFAGFRKHGLTAQPVEKLLPQFFLEVEDLLAERWLRDNDRAAAFVKLPVSATAKK